jgi:hypothetical protein
MKGTFEAMLRELFGDVQVRLRPSFFPYTEPSAEIDISCQSCGGAGCGTCKHTGWIEILGSGMVHPAVFEAVGYDGAVTGFAFGMGMERVAMLKYGVDDMGSSTRTTSGSWSSFHRQKPAERNAVKILVSWLRELSICRFAGLARTMSVRRFAVENIDTLAGGDAVWTSKLLRTGRTAWPSWMAREVATACGLR